MSSVPWSISLCSGDSRLGICYTILHSTIDRTSHPFRHCNRDLVSKSLKDDRVEEKLFMFLMASERDKQFAAEVPVSWMNSTLTSAETVDPDEALGIELPFQLLNACAAPQRALRHTAGLGRRFRQSQSEGRTPSLRIGPDPIARAAESA